MATKNPIHDREIIKEIFEIEKCDPNKHYITYCQNYFEKPKECPKTCYFARENSKPQKHRAHIA